MSRRVIFPTGAFGIATAVFACVGEDPGPTPAGPSPEASAHDVALSTDASIEGPSEGSASSRYREAVLADRPIAYWRMGTPQGDRILDEVGDNDLVLRGGGHVPSVPGVLEGDSDFALGFDGVESRAETVDSRAFDFPAGAPFTLECWGRREAIAKPSFFGYLIGSVEGFDTNAHGFSLYVTQGGGDGDEAGGVVEFGGAGTGVFKRPVVATGIWAHYALVNDGAELALFVDGERTVATKPPVKLGGRTSIFTVGRDPRAPHFWPGMIDEVAVYDHALSGVTLAAHRALAKTP